MKLHYNIPRVRRQAGIMLIECISYFVVFLILSAVAMSSFYLCWDHSKALISASDDISAALSAGERRTCVPPVELSTLKRQAMAKW
jgi:hypothetical protein